MTTLNTENQVTTDSQVNTMNNTEIQVREEAIVKAIVSNAKGKANLEATKVKGKASVEATKAIHQADKPATKSIITPKMKQDREIKRIRDQETELTTKAYQGIQLEYNSKFSVPSVSRYRDLNNYLEAFTKISIGDTVVKVWIIGEGMKSDILGRVMFDSGYIFTSASGNDYKLVGTIDKLFTPSNETIREDLTVLIDRYLSMNVKELELKASNSLKEKLATKKSKTNQALATYS